nr:MAG TPA: hypothetical protein [Caudoviricetes sp.]
MLRGSRSTMRGLRGGPPRGWRRRLTGSRCR